MGRLSVSTADRERAAGQHGRTTDDLIMHPAEMVANARSTCFVHLMSLQLRKKKAGTTTARVIPTSTPASSNQPEKLSYRSAFRLRRCPLEILLKLCIFS